MRKISFVGFLIMLFLFSCNRDDFNYNPATRPLLFSKDTIMLDTVFSSTRTETYRLMVYNNQNTDVVIPRIYLEKLQNSQFKINVDGFTGFDFQDVPLRSKDSLQIFIEMAPQAINSPEMIADEDLIFNTVGQTQRVKLLSLVENADFYFSESGTKEISSDLIWNNTKSRVIYGNLKFINGAKLTIEEGARIYLHKDANLIIDKGGEFIVNGSLNKEVIIRGDRHTEKYDSLPGNWNQIYLGPNTKTQINFATIKGGNNALFVEKNAELTISNTKIYNFTNSGIHSIGGNITGTNLAINNCGSSDLFLENGGNFDFTHCSFANGNTRYSLYLSNSYQKSKSIYYNTLNAIFKNCIFWTEGNNSIYLNPTNFAPFIYTFDTNLIKNTNGLNIDNNPNFINNIINKDPLFNNLNYSKNLLDLKNGSPAFGKGNINYAASVPLDILGISRIANPTIGAYQK